MKPNWLSCRMKVAWKFPQVTSPPPIQALKAAIAIMFVNIKTVVMSRNLRPHRKAMQSSAGNTHTDKAPLALGVAKHLVHGALLEGEAALALKLV